MERCGIRRTGRHRGPAAHTDIQRCSPYRQPGEAEPRSAIDGAPQRCRCARSQSDRSTRTPSDVRVPPEPAENGRDVDDPLRKKPQVRDCQWAITSSVLATTEDQLSRRQRHLVLGATNLPRARPPHGPRKLAISNALLETINPQQRVLPRVIIAVGMEVDRDWCFDRTRRRLPLVVRRHGRGFLVAVFAFHLGRRLPEGEVFQQGGETRLQPSKSLGARVGDVALERISSIIRNPCSFAASKVRFAATQDGRGTFVRSGVRNT